jgi:predicted glycosyltransferase
MDILKQWRSETGQRSGAARRNGHRTPHPARRRTRRVVLYSPGMVGFGHIRRNASIAQALRCTAEPPTIVMIAEARQAGALPMPEGVDCVTLPSLRKEADGWCRPRFLDLSEQEVIAIRAGLIRSTIKSFQPDVFIVDHLPLGAAGELSGTLAEIRGGGRTRCVLGLRDILQDPETVRETWREQGTEDAVRDCYDAVWIYGDPQVFDCVREYGINGAFAARVQYTGYLDARERLAFAGNNAAPLLASLPPGPLVLCLVGGGYDGTALAEAFVNADLPAGTTGVLVTGPYMSKTVLKRLRETAREKPQVRLVDFLAEPAPLILRADRVISMGGYNTMCEVLSFHKRALIVPRVAPKVEQWIRAERFRQRGLVDVLHPDLLSAEALSEWLDRDLAPPPPVSAVVHLDGLRRIPRLVEPLYENPKAEALGFGAVQ